MSHDGLLKLASRMFRFGALMCLFASSLWLTFGSPNTLKQAGRDSHIYEAAAKIAQDSAINTNIDASVKAGLNEAAASSFTPAYLQSVSEQFIDGTYHWLDGKAAKPDFHVDATNTVNQFLGKVADTTVANAAKLPPCGAGQVTDLNGLDLENLKCLPPNITPQILRDETIKRIKGNSNLLSNPVLTADSLSDAAKTSADKSATTTPSQTSGDKPFYEQLSPLPMYYRIASFLPWVFGGIALLASLWIFSLYHNSRKSIYRISRGLLWVGLPVFVAGLLGHFIFRSAASNGSLTHAVDGNLQQYGLAFFRSIEGAFAHNLLWISGAMTVIGGIVTIAFFISARRQDHNISVEHTSAPVASAPSAEPAAATPAPATSVSPTISPSDSAAAPADVITPSPLLDTKPRSLNSQLEDYPNLDRQDRPKYQSQSPAGPAVQDPMLASTPTPATSTPQPAPAVVPAPTPAPTEQRNVINVGDSTTPTPPSQPQN